MVLFSGGWIKDWFYSMVGKMIGPSGSNIKLMVGVKIGFHRRRSGDPPTYFYKELFTAPVVS